MRSSPRQFARLLWLALAFALSSAGQAFAHGVSLQLHTPLPEDSPLHRDFLTGWTQQVEQAAGNRIRFHPHPRSDAFAAGADPYASVQQGQIDLAWIPFAQPAKRFTSLAKFKRTDGADLEADSRALWEFARLNDAFDRDFDGVRVIALHCLKPESAGAAPIGVLVMSADSYRSLPDDLKAVIGAHSGAEVSASLGKVAAKP